MISIALYCHEQTSFDYLGEKLINISLTCISGFAGHRARDPPDPIPNSEVKLCSVPGCSAVFGHANPGKLAAPLTPALFSRR